MGYSFSWRFTIPALSRQATVYAVDSLGAGYSDRPAGLDCRLRSQAARLLGFLDRVGISSFDLVGTSYGGAVAMMAASMCAQRPALQLRKLVLVAPVNPWSPHGRRLAPFLGSKLGSTLFARSVDHMHWTFRTGWPVCSAIQSASAGHARRLCRPVSVSGSFEYALGVVRHWTEGLRELESILPRIADLPTLLIWGSADAAVYVQSAEKLRQHFKQCDLVCIRESVISHTKKCPTSSTRR